MAILLQDRHAPSLSPEQCGVARRGRRV